MAGIDSIIDASVSAVKKSGVLEAGAIMGVVTAVNGGGTVVVARGEDVYPNVRVLSGYACPRVGDRVEILRTAGGWVCIGALTTGPRIQSGSVVVPAGSASGRWGSVEVTFPHAFARTPIVVASGAIEPSSTSTDQVEVSVRPTSASSCKIHCRRGGTSATTVNWIATDF